MHNLLHTFLRLLLLLALTGCGLKARHAPSNQSVLFVIQNLPGLHSGWDYNGMGGGGGPEGGSFAYKIDLKGKSRNEVMEEICTSFKKVLVNAGMSVTGTGRGTNNGGLYSFTFAVSTSQTVAEVSVASAPIDEQSFVLVAAVAQTGFPK